MPKTLKPEEREELKKWLKVQHNIVINNRSRRDLSDVAPIALIIKKFNHKLVDMNNYPSRYSFALKLANWETFNYKVLTKMGLRQTATALHDLAQGLCGAVEILLYELMVWSRFQFAKRNGRSSSSSQANTEHSNHSEAGGSSIITAPLYENDVIDLEIEQHLEEGKVVKVTQKMIDYELYEQILRECKEKDKYINAIQQKASYLENIVKIKDNRITELVNQLTKLTVSILSKRHHLEGDNPSDAELNFSCDDNMSDGNATDCETTERPASAGDGLDYYTL